MLLYGDRVHVRGLLPREKPRRAAVSEEYIYFSLWSDTTATMYFVLYPRIVWPSAIRCLLTGSNLRQMVCFAASIGRFAVGKGFSHLVVRIAISPSPTISLFRALNCFLSTLRDRCDSFATRTPLGVVVGQT